MARSIIRACAVATIVVVSLGVGNRNTTNAQIKGFTQRATVTVDAGMLVANGSLLAASSGSVVRLIDVADPDMPRVVGQHEFADEILGLASTEQLLFVANSHEGLHQVDISTPSIPEARSVLRTRGQAVGVAVTDEYAFVADNSVGFDIVSVVGDGSRIGEYLGDGFPRAIGAAGDLVFVADQPNGLIVVDVSIPVRPDPMAVLSLGADMITQVIVSSEFGSGESGLIVCVFSAGAGLQVVDVSDPQMPQVVGSVPLSGPPLDVVLHRQELFAISNGKLEQFSLSEPSQPLHVASINVGSQAGSVAVNDELIFVASGAEIVVFDRP